MKSCGCSIAPELPVENYLMSAKVRSQEAALPGPGKINFLAPSLILVKINDCGSGAGIELLRALTLRARSLLDSAQATPEATRKRGPKGLGLATPKP